MAVITLNKANREKEVNRNISLKIEKEGVDIGFVVKRKGLGKVCKIV